MEFNAMVRTSGRTAEIQLTGGLDEASVPLLRAAMQRVLDTEAEQVLIRLDGLDSISAAGMRCLLAVQQSNYPAIDTVLLGDVPKLRDSLHQAGLDAMVWESVAGEE